MAIVNDIAHPDVAKKRYRLVRVVSAYTARPDDLVAVVTASGAITVTLPASPAPGTCVAVGDDSTLAGTNAITVAAAALIDGNATITLGQNGVLGEFMFDGTTWIQIMTKRYVSRGDRDLVVRQVADLKRVLTPPPVLLAMSYDQGQPEGGGDAVVLTFVSTAGISSVKFGAASAAFVITDATRVTATLPANAAGVVQVTASNAGGASNGLPFEYWSPASLASPRGLHLRADGSTGYLVAGPNRRFVDVSGNARHYESPLASAPPFGVPVLGNALPLPNGTPPSSGGNILGTTITAAAILGAPGVGGKYVKWMLVRRDSLPAVTTPTENGAQIEGNAGAWSGSGFIASGGVPAAYVWHWNGGYFSAVKTGLAVGVWYLIIGWWDSSSSPGAAFPIHIEVNGSAGTDSAGVTQVQNTSTQPQLFSGYDNATGRGHEGPCLEFGALPGGSMTASERLKTLKYARQRYGLLLT